MNFSISLLLKKILYLLLGRFNEPKLDIVFVAPPKNAENWILHAICEELQSRAPSILKCSTVPADEKLPLSRNYFFSHYMYFRSTLKKISYPNYKGNFIFFTHLENSKHNISDHQVVNLLGNSNGIVCMNSESAKFFSQFRKIRNKITVAVGGASQHIFRGHQRSQNGAIGFVSAFYKRKNPKLMMEIIHSLPEKKFILLGRNWENYERFHELFAFNNLTYLDVPYSEYPDIYAKMSVFISTSIIEGGPIPLIESMMSNVVPVVTNTGFANDLIKHGENGYIFDTTARVTDVIDLINKAFILETDVRESVLGFTWDAFASEVMSIMNGEFKDEVQL